MDWNLKTEVLSSLDRLARDEALLSKEAHAYLPKTPEEAEHFEPHEWVLEAMRRAYVLGREAGDRNARDVMRRALGITG